MTRARPRSRRLGAVVSFFVSTAALAALARTAGAQTTVQAPTPAGTAGADTSAPPPGPQNPRAMYTTQSPQAGSGNGLTTGTIGGGNATESSAHPVTGEEEDSFDLGSSRAAAATGGGSAHGDENGPVFAGARARGLGAPTGEVPDTYAVRSGDTLWGICDTYFRNPYEWPRVWSYNPQIKNPHWIYPGDEVHLRRDAGGAERTAATAPAEGGRGIIDRRRQVPNDTVFLRDQGWVREDSDEVWGDVSGSAQDKMFLSDLDEIYLAINRDHDVHLGQELTIFRPRHTAAAGWIVQILGTARVDEYDAHTRVARARIVESLDVIERGAKIGPLTRKFAVIPPRRNDVDVTAHILASVHPNEFYGQNQVLFIDKGEAAGLHPGNRLFVIRRGDAWRRSLVTPGAGYRVSADDERPMPPMESVPGAGRRQDQYPEEIVAELRVLDVKKDSATCLVSQSRNEVEGTDIAVARKGY